MCTNLGLLENARAIRESVELRARDAATPAEGSAKAKVQQSADDELQSRSSTRHDGGDRWSAASLSVIVPGVEAEVELSDTLVSLVRAIGTKSRASEALAAIRQATKKQRRQKFRSVVERGFAEVELPQGLKMRIRRT